MLRRFLVTASLIALTSAAAPANASADWLFTPFVGATFGGSANIGGLGEDLDDEFERKLNYGATLAWMGGGVVGFELDFGYSPNFFEVSPDDDDFDLTRRRQRHDLHGQPRHRRAARRRPPVRLGGRRSRQDERQRHR